MESLPRTQSAIIGLPNGELGFSDSVELPELEEDMFMVQNMAVGVNPVDTKMTGKLLTAGAVSGMDFAGVVVACGSGARAAVPVSVGDRVCGAVQGMHSLSPLVGAFTEYVGATAHVVLKLPDEFSFEEGASLGSGIATIGLALFRSLQIPGFPLEPPPPKPRHVLIYGGSSATGTLAIQLVKLSGLKPITTCSPRNFELVKFYGAEQAFDYRSPFCTAEIRAYTKNSLKYVLDCISEPETMMFCYECIGRLGGSYTALEPFPDFLHTRKNVKPDWVLGPSLLGKPIAWNPPFRQDGNPEILEFASKWFSTAQKLLDQGLVKPHPIQKMPGGLHGILDGMKLLQEKKISGKKLVYTLA